MLVKHMFIKVLIFIRLLERLLTAVRRAAVDVNLLVCVCPL